MSTPLVLGVDGGATKTECALATLDGAEVALGRGGPSNHESVGYDQAAATVAQLVTEALAHANAKIGDLAGACFAMAGMDLPPDRDHIRERIVDPLGLTCPVAIFNDALAAFRAGSPRGIGVCVSLGSGSTFCGRNAQGKVIQFEFPKPAGSIDERVMMALFAEYQGVGPHCRFGQAYVNAIGLASLEELHWSMFSGSRDYAPKKSWPAISDARRALFSEAYHDDPVLCRLLARHAADLSEILLGIADALELGDDAFDLVLSGSLMTKGRHPALNDTLIELIKEKHPRADGIVVDGPPVEGALRIAAELAATR